MTKDNNRQNLILELFLNKKELSFADIQHTLRMRSNYFAYYLKQMLKNNLIEKNNKYYRLTKISETLLPYMQQKKTVLKLSVIVLAIQNNKGEFALIRRTKRPYDGYFAMPGGKIFVKETVNTAAQRIALNEAKIHIKNIQVCAVIDEHLVEKELTKNSWFLFLVKSRTCEHGENVEWIKINKLKEMKIIPSDLLMMKKLTRRKVHINHVVMDDSEGQLQCRKLNKKSQPQ